jgi:uncharacterized membrane protein YphA (DoxX/SURF4 family)
MRYLVRRPLAAEEGALPDALLLFARIFIVIALIPNGIRKIATFGQTSAAMGGTPQMINGQPFPDQTPLFYFPFPELFLGASVTFDLLGAVLIILGAWTRAVAMFLAGYVLLAIAIYHSDIRHMQDVIYLLRGLAFPGGLLALVYAGGGAWSVDGWRARGRAP